MRLLFKIMSGAEWQLMQQSGRFEGSAVDRRDGFIHLSAAHQLRETAAKHFAGQPGLMLVAVEEGQVDGLRWEPSRGGDLFPHIYGAMPLAAVAWARPLPWADGGHRFPDEAGL